MSDISDSVDKSHGMVSLDGISWFEAPIPRQRHQCWPQSWGWVNFGLVFVQRCACGGIRMHDRGSWLERNTRVRG